MTLNATEMDCGLPLSVLYAAQGVGLTTSSLYTISTVDGSTTEVGALGVALSCLAFDTVTDTMYGITSASSAAHPESIVTVNLATGAATAVAALSGHTPAYVDFAIVFNAGQMLGFDGYTLFSIDKATGVCTTVAANWIGPTEAGALLQPKGVALGIKGGYLYTWSDSDQIQRVDITTGASLYSYTHMNQDRAALAVAIDESGKAWDIEAGADETQIALGYWSTIDDQLDPDPDVGQHANNPAVSWDLNPSGFNDGGDTIYVALLSIESVDALAWGPDPIKAMTCSSASLDPMTCD